MEWGLGSLRFDPVWRKAQGQHVSKAMFEGQTAPNDKEGQHLVHICRTYSDVGAAQSRVLVEKMG